MKNYFPMLLFGALALTASMMTSCEKEQVVTPTPQYSITVAANTGGHVKAMVNGNAVTEVPEGVEVTLTATSDDGYEFSGWTVESGDITLSGNPATFTMPAQDVSVRAEFVEETLNIFNKITDPGFLYYCQDIMKFDTNRDGIFSLEEAQKVTEINVNEWYKVTGDRIITMAGIEYFTSLTTLTCYGNAIADIDLSKNTELTHLHVGTNKLTKLDIAQNTKLVEFYCGRNAITKIDLSKCLDLEKFECKDSGELTSLDFSNNKKLIEVNARLCPKLTSLDFSNNPALVTIYCHQCNLSSLNVSACKELELLHCFDNKISSLDISNCSVLEFLDCSGNRLPSLDISKVSSLQSLHCHKNRMATFDASTMGNTDYSLGCGVQTTDGSTSQTLKLTLREAQKPHWEYNMVPYQDMNANVELVGESADVFASITDPIFKAYCQKYDTNHDGKLSPEEASVVTELILSKMDIGSLDGLDFFIGITKLVCDHNKLTSLNVYYNSALVDLVCNDNLITEFVAPRVTANSLATLDCQNNQLTSLNVVGCNLTSLNCQNNKLTELRMNFKLTLSTMDCSNNKLTELSLQIAESLTSLNCQKNELTKLSLHDCPTLAFLTCSNNQLPSLDVSNKTTLMSLMCNNNPMTSLNISGCTSLMGVMAYENRLLVLDASQMGSPNGYNLFCGNQTSDGTTAQTLTLTLREEQKPYWEASMKDSFMNANIVLAN